MAKHRANSAVGFGISSATHTEKEFQMREAWAEQKACIFLLPHSPPLTPFSTPLEKERKLKWRGIALNPFLLPFRW